MRSVILTVGSLVVLGAATYLNLGGLVSTLSVVAFFVGILDVLSSMGAVWKK